MLLSLLSAKTVYDKNTETFVSGAGDSYYEVYNVVFNLFFTVGILWVIISAYGASRLSYFYNMNTGNTGGIIYFWAVLCFLFSDLYYPFYSYFLNPISRRSGNNIQIPTVN
jgi:hypothetical protein